MTNLIDMDLSARASASGSSPHPSRSQTESGGQKDAFAAHLKTDKAKETPEEDARDAPEELTASTPLARSDRASANHFDAVADQTTFQETDAAVTTGEETPAESAELLFAAAGENPTPKPEVSAVEPANGEEAAPAPKTTADIESAPAETAAQDGRHKPSATEPAPGEAFTGARIEAETRPASSNPSLEAEASVQGQSIAPENTERVPADTADAPPLPEADPAEHKVAASGSDGLAQRVAASSEAPSTPLVTAATTATTATTSATPVATAAQASQPPILTAPPADIPDIVAQSLTSVEDHKDRIMVQLDPPELGRVTIDFKFDASGLQHVTITGETPEALKQLRQMHFELLQALEREGLTRQDMTFKQHDPRSDTGGQTFQAAISDEANQQEGRIESTPHSKQVSPSVLANASAGGGLDIRL